ncbi:MAG: hypothetical protein OXC63_05200 [Aestuariivita sp.]|nr:hypothetical protein [Aestuariivita sp.]
MTAATVAATGINAGWLLAAWSALSMPKVTGWTLVVLATLPRRAKRP